MQCCIESLKFIKGEKRKIVLFVHSKKNEEFSILSAQIEVRRYDTIIETPLAEINDHEISFIVDTADYEKGKYDVVLTYVVADEKIIAKFMLEVV